MTRLWLSLLFLAGVAFAAAWVASNPGEVVIRWDDWRIDTSLAFLLFFVIAITWLCAVAYALFHDLVRAPKHFAERRQLAHYEQGLQELTYSVAALASNDNRDAQAHARKARRLLGTTPMGLMIAAQIAKSEGDEETTRALLKQMLAHKETSTVATRLLTGSVPEKPEKNWKDKLRALFT